LIEPWIGEGVLPNLARLVENGASGRLQSAIPPLTPPAWTSFMTGKNPGKHGIFHFLEPQPGSYAMRYSNAGSRRAASIWRLLSDAGFTVGSVNVPFTFPPEKCAAFQISGMDTPSEKSAFIHPPELRAELEGELGKIDLEIRYLGFMSTDERRDQVLEGMARLDEQWTRIGLHLLEKHPADVMMLTFMSIDTVQHYFWHYMDARHFQHDARGAKKYGDAIQSVYRRLDAMVGRFLEKLPPETHVVVVSDHGGGPTSDRTVFLNRHLAQLGLLKYREGATSALGKLRQRVVRAAYEAVRGALTSGQKKKLASLFPALRQKFEGAATSFGNIDWAGTKAYCSEVLASPPSIWINLKGARPNGIVEPGEYEALRDFIAAKLGELRDPRDGSPVIPRVYKREELFHGPFAGEAPDLILDWWSDNAFQTGTSFPEDTAKPVLQIRERAPMTEPEWSGTHRLDGILIVKGPAARKAAQIQGARLMDMTPTLLHLMGQKVPDDMDGRVLAELFTDEFLREHPIGAKSAAAEAEAVASTPYSAEEAAQVEERLKALGYID
jgi:predicted AlkP superfamily phosphohydrolase/phosphomutase